MMVRAPTIAVAAAMPTSAVDIVVAADPPAPATMDAIESAMDDKKMSPTCTVSHLWLSVRLLVRACA
jgi:hypothetical protein